jgi:hypothetical protein
VAINSKVSSVKMKRKHRNILIALFVIGLTDAGLLGVAADSLFRGNYTTIDFTSTILVIGFPIIAIFGLIGGELKIVSIGIMIVATFCSAYFGFIYKTEMLFDIYGILFILGYLGILILGRQLILWNTDKIFTDNGKV